MTAVTSFTTLHLTDEDISVSAPMPTVCAFSRISDEEISITRPTPMIPLFSKVSDEDIALSK